MKDVEKLSLGIFHPAYMPAQHIREQMEATLPGNIHILASQRLGVSLTHWTSGQNVIVTDFASRKELIQVGRCWAPGPRWGASSPPRVRGSHLWGGDEEVK